ncbi:hypothetical protein DPMN_142506 [Dreissena polymorpha]|uniref:Uncharacterized protein n=1 Tax=Dreissena polymorpha TaxID=45954 RepID=A0A9D4GBF1_DREPO|nr:hypothetical protein DPMN_142506 [Dreissena polymorpha]
MADGGRCKPRSVFQYRLMLNSLAILRFYGTQRHQSPAPTRLETHRKRDSRGSAEIPQLDLIKICLCLMCSSQAKDIINAE